MIWISSVNIASEPREVGTLRGRLIVSSIHKRPVEGYVEVSFDGLGRDTQANEQVHGGKNHKDQAVYIMPAVHLAEYSRFLGRSVKPGMLGENLTVEGDRLLESEVRVGTRFRAGDVLLRVTKPRRPCGPLAAFLGVEAVRFMTDTGYCGFYCEVLETGSLTTGMQMFEVDRPDGAETILEQFRRKSRQKPGVPGLDD